ncbi:hypothetical protein [Mycolicibacterium sp. P9-22]|nr:hypothetical protein [Mycolicibacterium sp. P9-22]
MSTTLAIESLFENNIREPSKLGEGTDIGATTLLIESTEGFADGDILYVG